MALLMAQRHSKSYLQGHLEIRIRVSVVGADGDEVSLSHLHLEVVGHPTLLRPSRLKVETL